MTLKKNNQTPPYKRVLLKLSGEALAGKDLGQDQKPFGIRQEMLEKIAEDIRDVYRLGVQVCVVVGGGNIFRGVQGVSAHKIDRTTSDHMGILATVINGLALRHAIEAQEIPCRLMSAVPMNTIAQHYVRQMAIRHLEKGRVIIFVAGTGNPYFTTDTAATLRATEMGCDLLLKGTKVDGVFDKDPHRFADAQFYPQLTYQKAIEEKLAIMDTTAITLALENHIPLRIFSIYRDNAFFNAINSKGPYTDIHCVEQ